VYERGYTLNGARQTLAEEYGDTKISADLDMEMDNLEVVVDSQLIEELEAVLVSLKQCF
jgi:hypothetical protein